ncbi:uncharacterized protein TNCV_3673731 [Trichonephila clavipes]|nr:uncharacterized protein TNCV_3673731 [Trichonephila clavipes]
MLRDFSETDSVDENSVQRNVKKRNKTGRMKDVMKKLRTSRNEIGENCRCFRYKCFPVISPEERQLQQRRNRKDDGEASNHVSSYCYRVRARIDNDTLQDVTVCHKAFLFLQGITNRRIQTLKKQLIEFSEAQLDGRAFYDSLVPASLMNEGEEDDIEYADDPPIDEPQ